MNVIIRILGAFAMIWPIILSVLLVTACGAAPDRETVAQSTSPDLCPVLGYMLRKPDNAVEIHGQLYVPCEGSDHE